MNDSKLAQILQVANANTELLEQIRDTVNSRSYFKGLMTGLLVAGFWVLLIEIAVRWHA